MVEVLDPSGKPSTVPACPKLQRQIETNMDRDATVKENQQKRRDRQALNGQPVTRRRAPERKRSPSPRQDFPELPKVLIRGYSL